MPNRLRYVALVLILSFMSTIGTAQAVTVDVAKPLQKKIIDWDEYTGRFRAIEEVDIRALVTGYLESINFRDGQQVKKGDVLFVIDPRPFRYVLKRTQAQYDLAKKQYERVIKLKKDQYVAQEEIDQRYQEMLVAKTQVEEAKLNLEFTEVKSPIDGQISRYFVSIGNLITMNDTILTRVVSNNPIHFYFDINQNDLLKYIRLANEGKRQNSNEAPTPIKIKLQDETDFVHKGKVNFVDNVIDRGTGTIEARALVPNDKHIIYPGLFGRARMAGSSLYQAILLPDIAINSDQSKKFVYVVDNNNQIKRVYVQLGPIRDSGFYVIKQGLKGNEKVVIHGIQRIRSSDQKVMPNLIQLKESGS